MDAVSTEGPAPAGDWAKPSTDVLAKLHADEQGLAADVAEERLRETGPNALAAERPASAVTVLARQFRSPLIYLLMVAAAVTLAVGEEVDAAVIGVVLAFNATVGFIQELRAARSLEALRALAQARARVLRDGREREVDAATLVPGDIVLLEAGAKVPADARVLHASALEVDESMLTGESTTVAKGASAVAPDAVLGDRTSMVHMGTTVTTGHARVLVVATGAATELGRIAGSVRSIGETETPLQQRIGRFTRVIAIVVPVLAASGFVLGTATGHDRQELLLSMVALAVATIPEGLPIVLTVTLAIGVNRMARRRALIRRLPAVETLGSCTVIGSDKTGTLTQNRMTVERIVAGGRRYEVTGAGDGADGEILGEDGAPVALAGDEPLRLALTAVALCNEASAVQAEDGLRTQGDPTEVALLVAAMKAGLDADELEDELPRVADIPFDSERRYAATFHRAAGRRLTCVKGAPERVLPMCASAAGAHALDADAVHAAADELAAAGLRVLACAWREEEAADDAGDLPAKPQDLVFGGLLGMMDPPRAEAAAAVRDCRDAGIRAVMITGDHAATALAIARELGIAQPGSRALTGRELDALDDDALDTAVGEVPVFARVAPEHKLRIVRALQRTGEVVAVTGDGVNDAPALKAADIGVAMGRSGTDAAKEAADMVVTDDNFASIVSAVEQGRVAFDNVRKTTAYLLSGSAAAAIAVLTSLLLSDDLPLLPAQLLWLNLVCYGIQDVALAFEPGERGVLRRAPRRLQEGVISRVLAVRIGLAGALMATGTLTVFLLAIDRGASLAEARTIAVTQLVVFMVLHVGSSRSETLSIFAKSPFSNRFLLLGTVTALGIHIAALHLPFTQEVLRFEPLSLGTWAVITAVGLSVIVLVELHKAALGDGLRARRPGRS